VLDKQFANAFFSSFILHVGHRNNMEEKNYVGMDLPFYGEAGSINFIALKVSICNL